MSNVSRLLDTRVQSDARSISREVFNHLVAIDNAVKAQNKQLALQNYSGILEDIERFIDLTPLPKTPDGEDVALRYASIA